MPKKHIIPIYPDPLYDSIAIKEEIQERFLSNPLIAEEVQRAKGIANLGLVKYVFPTASHTKFEHHLGTYKLIRETEGTITYLNAREVRILKYLNFFSCFGYLPFAYCTSEALLLTALANQRRGHQRRGQVYS